MTSTNSEQYAEVLTLEQALDQIQTSPPLRKIKEMLDRTDLSADTKALLYDAAKITVKIGETVVAVGRRIIDIAYKLVTKFPNTTFAVVRGRCSDNVCPPAQLAPLSQLLPLP